MKIQLCLISCLFIILATEGQPINAGAEVRDGEIKNANLEIQPLKPGPGSRVKILYNPQNTTLSGVKDFIAIAYLLEGGTPLAVEVPLTEDKGIWSGSVKTNDTTRALLFSFSKKEGAELISDNNQNRGYYTFLYDRNGKPVIGAFNALSIGVGNYASVWNMKRNAEWAKELNEKEFSFEESRAKLYNEYFTYLGQTGSESDKELLKRELQKHLSQDNLSEYDMLKARHIYKNVLKDNEKAYLIYSAVKTKFPDGVWRFDRFHEEPVLLKKEVLFNELVANPAYKHLEKRFYSLAQVLAENYADSADYAKVEQYLGYIKDKGRAAMIYHYLAFKLSGGSVYAKPVNLVKSLEYVQRALQLIEEDRKAPSDKPPYRTASEFAKSQNHSYHSYLGTYAIALYHNNEIEKAYAIQKQVADLFQGAMLAINETYCFLTEKVKGSAAAQLELERYISAGNANPAMKDQLKAIYLKNHTTAQFKSYLENLETATFQALRSELAKKMTNTPAPVFTLKNLTGENISLASLKGKVVILDFWATWCGPCIASFPAMQLAMEKYKDNPDVVFLFINTYETEQDKGKLVSDFIQKNKYPFHVLYDIPSSNTMDEFLVVSQYQVKGIPTKVVIDRNGNIRFRSSGFNGSVDRLVHEITAMVELAGAFKAQPIDERNAKEVVQ